MKEIISILTRRTFGMVLCSLVITLTVVSCINNDTDYSVPGGDPSGAANPFNFATTESVQLNVKYNVPVKGYQVLFEIYFENPFIRNEEGQIVKRSDVEPKLVRMTDGSGEYHSKETIAADYGADIYIYTSYIGVPGLHKTTIDNGVINADINWDTMSDTNPVTRAGGEYQEVPSGYSSILGTWDVKGRPNYLDAEGALDLSPSIYKTINSTLVEGGNCPAEYRQSADFEVSDPDGRDVEVWVRFVGGRSSASSTFGYYCYTKGASFAEIQMAKKQVVFPNTKTGVAIKGGESVKLHYIDKMGVDKGTVFPNGVKIGWFIINDAFRSGVIGSGYGAFCSTTSLNADRRTHTAAFRINDFILLSFEDWTDQDYNDVQFNVYSNPIEAIVSPEVPEVKPETPEDDISVAYRMTYKGILAFEDNWPAKGDYDLNDVVVKYNSVLSFNTKNEVLTTEDTFTALWSGALYKNGFAYQMNTERNNVKCELIEGDAWNGQGLDQNLSEATVNVIADALAATGTNTKTSTYKIKNTFMVPVDHNVFGAAPYNPFIFVHQNMNQGRKEVHLVNHKPTTKVGLDLFHTGNDLSEPDNGIYYIAAGKYPFAIHLIDAETFSTTETEAVDKTYPAYTKWVESNGVQNKDWYK